MFFFSFHSSHGAALKKNVGNLSRKVLHEETRKSAALTENESGDESNGASERVILPEPPLVKKSRKFSEAVDIEAVMSTQAVNGSANYSSISSSNTTTNNGGGEESEGPKDRFVQAKSTNISLKAVSLAYGWSQVFNVIAGGFAITPSGEYRRGHFVSMMRW